MSAPDPPPAPHSAMDATARLLDRDSPPDYIRAWTARISAPENTGGAETESAVIFRIGVEWLALPTALFEEGAERCALHGLPHRRSNALAGLVVIRGEPVPCVLLEAVLGLEKPAQESPAGSRCIFERLLVINRQGSRVAFPVSEVHGVHRHSPAQLREVPATLAGATAIFTTGMLPFENRTVGCLDSDLLFYAIERSFS